ncbi:MAG TPA: tryptophanase [Prolixibacteraceae bacterium]|nr:tryptophanase [Prolixibacteraceae bacterium]
MENFEQLKTVKFYSGETTPLEMHKVRVVQKLNLLPIEERKEAIFGAGFNTFLLQNKDVFLDMLTDSGTNAMSDNQVAAMSVADDSYAGSASYYKLEKAIKEVFNQQYFLPVHQGRAAEHIIAKTFCKPGTVVPMNYHFTTTKAHIEMMGSIVEEIYTDEALKTKSVFPFKGNMDIPKLNKVIEKWGAENVAYIRFEAGTNLIGGQPFSMANLREVSVIAKAHKIMLLMDTSLINENLYFIKIREEGYQNRPIVDILHEMLSYTDFSYFSGRKVSCTRGGGICTNNHDIYMKMRDWVPLYEGFLTYGGMSVREIEAMAVGLYETLDFNVISHSPTFIKYLVDALDKEGIPVITPAGGLGCHLNAGEFIPHVPQTQYPAGALAAALFVASGIRGMERGTISSVRDENGDDILADVELLRLAFPRRVFTLSQIKYAEDRIKWLYDNRELIGGLEWIEEPPVLRFFVGKLKPIGNWVDNLVAKFRADFGESL